MVLEHLLYMFAMLQISKISGKKDDYLTCENYILPSPITISVTMPIEGVFYNFLMHVRFNRAWSYVEILNQNNP